jgi:lipoprotein-anchoring transpeptidase ErfK/SrfK
MKRDLGLLIGLLLLLTGCSGIPGVKDANGWTPADRRDFLSIYQEDTYASACGLDGLYQQYRVNKDTAILSQMFVGYIRNLENSCLDLSSFRSAQASRRGKGAKSYFDLDQKPINSAEILARLKKAKNIEEVLSPHIPKNPQFKKLLSHFKPGDTSDTMRIIRLNIERTKLTPQSGWDTWIEVNVPEFMLRFYEGGSNTMQFPIVVGKPAWQTPIFSSVMKYIVLNPTWTMTSNIVREDLIRKVLRNPSYLKRHNMKVYNGYGNDAVEVDPSTIDWKKYAGKNNKTPIPFRVVQGSSSKNALGTVKFMFPNRFSVYMHDTQAKSLFKRKSRAFSHGCMRLSKPKELLKKVATGYAATSLGTIEKHQQSHKISYVKLQKHIPVHILYQTAYVGSGGLQFFPDVYGFDKTQRLR